MANNLKDILEDVNNWLKYAEAKNALIIVLNSSLIVGLSNVSDDITNSTIYILFLTSILMLLISIVIAIMSFIPRLKTPQLKKQNILEDDNLIHYVDIRKYTATQYYEKIEKILPKENRNKDFEMYYAEQIVTNSRIAFIKFKQFEAAAWFLLAAFLTPIGALILSKVRK